MALTDAVALDVELTDAVAELVALRVDDAVADDVTDGEGAKVAMETVWICAPVSVEVPIRLPAPFSSCTTAPLDRAPRTEPVLDVETKG